MTALAVGPCLLEQGHTTNAPEDTMGYTTEFTGKIDVHPPLNADEITFLTQFAHTRHMKRTTGPYVVEEVPYSHNMQNVIDQNAPHDGQPGLWCKWIPTTDGTAIEWSGAEKFYDSVEWMQYLIDHFLGHNAKAVGHVEGITGGHSLQGIIHAEGEDMDDVWDLVVINNKVMESRGTLSAHTMLQLAQPLAQTTTKDAQA